MTDELVVELGLEPAGDELGGGERVAGGGVSLMLTRPVSLTHNKPILSHPGLGPPLLYVRPSHLQQSVIIHSYCQIKAKDLTDHSRKFKSIFKVLHFQD